ncbi:hypothetical protein PVK06_030781 [Gossypium arboreum]|uniref:Uncharacterized protein n=1 Tax=Gossypium arboreum TaxID=29729 RepID=A0ABR0NP74_GOSAR|nr:hypothetical protein PVK06_030781 [Gossypium arboreum]
MLIGNASLDSLRDVLGKIVIFSRSRNWICLRTYGVVKVDGGFAAAGGVLPDQSERVMPIVLLTGFGRKRKSKSNSSSRV